MALERKEGVGVKSTGLPNYSTQEKKLNLSLGYRNRISKDDTAKKRRTFIADFSESALCYVVIFRTIKILHFSGERRR